MPESPEKIEGEELLVLILKTNRLRKSAAIRSLGVDEETVGDWISSLENEGWIQPVEKETEDPLLKISETAFKKIDKIKKDLVGEEPIKEKKENIIRKTIRRINAIDRLALLDALIILPTLLSLYLIYKFVMNPNKESLSFLVGMVLFSIVVLIYKEYEKISKTRGVFGAVVMLIRTLVEISKRRKKHILAGFTLLAMLYFVGISVSSRKIHYIILAVVSLTTYILIYQPRQSNRANLRFYIGMLLLTYSLLLLGGFSKPMGIRLLNFLLGLTILAVLQVKEGYFGVGMTSFNKMLNRI